MSVYFPGGIAHTTLPSFELYYVTKPPTPYILDSLNALEVRGLCIVEAHVAV